METVANFFESLGLSFITIFVAVDAIGTLPILLALTQDEESSGRSKTVRYAILTAMALGLGFIAIGKFVFSVLGILSVDFLIAGGLILLALSVKDLVSGKMVEPTVEERMFGVVLLCPTPCSRTSYSYHTNAAKRPVYYSGGGDFLCAQLSHGLDHLRSSQ